MVFADPKNDLAFKKIFGNENKKEILISLLNSILKFEGSKQIETVEIADSYQIPKISELKETILDIKAVNQAGEHFIVEMQRKDLGDFSKRSLYYTSKAYINQLDKGMNYEKLRKVYFIGILNFNIFENKDYVSRHLILNLETKQQDIEDFEFTFIELKKFNKTLTELKSILDKWIYFIKNAQNLDIIPDEYQNIHEFQEAFHLAIQQSWNKDEMRVYDYMAIREMDEINALKTAEKKGVKKGIEEGIEKGISEGRKQERRESDRKIKLLLEKSNQEKAELKKQAKLDLALQLLDILSDDIISLKTTLSIDDIKKLRNENA